jgi:hypothetical protein
MDIVILAGLALGIALLLSGMFGSKKPEPPKPRPTERDKVVCEMVLENFGKAIANMTPAGRDSLIEAIKQRSVSRE